MGYREDMENCRRYISSHPDENLTAEKLAGKYGYSFFHFCHVFKSCNGISVGEYLRDARLGMAAEYAVFEVPESDGLDELHENIQKTWKFVFGEWFDGSGYRFDHKAMDFEYYIGDRTFIYVPVKEA